MPKGHAKRYTIRQNYRGKKGWSVVGATGVVHGTHSTRAAAIQQQAAIYTSQAASKSMDSDLTIDYYEDDFLDDEEDIMDDGDDEMEYDVEKAYDTRQRRDMARRGQAMPDGSFPIANRNDLANAIQSVGRASDYEAARRHIVRRARALGMTNMLPEEWTSKSLTSIFKSLPSHAKRNNSIGNAQTSFNIFSKGL